MHVSDGGAALALQPESEGEKTALTRLRAIFRRATQYRLPGPYWVDAAEFTELEASGPEALVVQDGAEGAAHTDAGPPIGVLAGSSGPEHGPYTVTFDEKVREETKP